MVDSDDMVDSDNTVPVARGAGEPSARSLFALLAPIYDRLVPLISRRARRMGVALLEVRDGETVVDVGTGTGLALPRLAGANPSGRTLGVDATPAMLRRARTRIRRRRLSSVDLRIADAAHLPFATGSIDAVFSSYVLDTMEASRRQRAIREAARVLRPGGRLAVVSMARPSTPGGAAWAALARAAPPLLGRARPIRLLPRLAAEGLRAVSRVRVRQCGFPSEIVRARHPHPAAFPALSQSGVDHHSSVS